MSKSDSQNSRLLKKSRTQVNKDNFESDNNEENLLLTTILVRLNRTFGIIVNKLNWKRLRIQLIQ